MSRIKELSKEELEYRKKLKQMAQSGIDMTERVYVPSNNFAEWYAQSLSAIAQLCIAANRKLPFKDDEFDLIIFDPPHLIHAGDNSWLKLKYGCLPKDWSTYIKAGFDECMRVLKPTGTLLFKWSNNQIPFTKVFNVIDQKPILGDRRGSTRWSVFIKGERKDESRNI